MSLSRTTLRLITILFLLAGILLLRKPVFGQPIIAAPTRFSVVSASHSPIFATLSSSLSHTPWRSTTACSDPINIDENLTKSASVLSKIDIL